MPATARVKEPSSQELPLEERIRRRAYELYILRGNQSGSEYDDWLQAEEEVRRATEHQKRLVAPRLVSMLTIGVGLAVLFITKLKA
jgi:hypothetical protein